MSKLYAVHTSHGQYDDSCTRLEGVFNNHDSALIFCDKIRLHYATLLHAPCPFTNAPLFNDNNMKWSKWVNSLTNEEYDTYHKWQCNVDEAERFNVCWIDEIELNVPIYEQFKTL